MCLFQIVSCIVTLGIGAFIFAIAICDDIKSDLNSTEQFTIARRNRFKIAKQLSNFVQYHSESKQLILLSKNSTIAGLFSF